MLLFVCREEDKKEKKKFLKIWKVHRHTGDILMFENIVKVIFILNSQELIEGKKGLNKAIIDSRDNDGWQGCKSPAKDLETSISKAERQAFYLLAGGTWRGWWRPCCAHFHAGCHVNILQMDDAKLQRHGRCHLQAATHRAGPVDLSPPWWMALSALHHLLTLGTHAHKHIHLQNRHKKRSETRTMSQFDWTEWTVSLLHLRQTNQFLPGQWDRLLIVWEWSHDVQLCLWRKASL